MGVFAGPKTTQDTPIFIVDGRNINSFPNNGKIKSLVSSEEKNTTATAQDGYLKSNYGYIDKFTGFSISNSSAITVSISVDNTELKSGTAFSICDDISTSYIVSGITSYSSGIVTTVSLATTSHSLNLSPSGITSYSVGIVTTVSLATTSHSLNLSPSGITSYSVGVVTTVSLATTSHSLNLSASGIGTYSTGIVTTTSTGIFPSIFNPQFELSCSLSSTGILITNKNSNDHTYFSQSLETQGKDIYSIVFRTLGVGTSPVTVYRNGAFLSQSDIKTGTSQFQNVGISLFNLRNAYYSEYGVRFISIYNKELNDQEVKLINNLKTN